MGQAAGSSRQQQQATGSTAGLSAVVFG